MRFETRTGNMVDVSGVDSSLAQHLVFNQIAALPQLGKGTTGYRGACWGHSKLERSWRVGGLIVRALF